uniref:Metal-nicotianamine transporter YSL7 n=1 Tax=Leersia perrieri TaxID=77586 RepID=A0A0D9VBB8_9ORYZ
MEPFSDFQEGISTEHAFEAEPVPSLSETITLRSLVVSFIMCATLSVVAMKVTLSSGFIPSFSIPAGLLGFCVSRAWIRILDYFMVSHLPFTRQENTIIQTCVVACTSITYTGGFGTYILAMTKKAAGGDVKDDNNIEEPSIARMVTFLFLISFAGMFIIMPFRKVMIIRHRLTFPNGTATAHLINSFHTPQGVKQARKQVMLLFKSFGGTIAWSLFQWFFSSGRGCGFKFFPTFGLEAYKHGFFFDFSMANVGIGMMCPYMIMLSMFIGTIVSWGMLWPYIETKEGIWYPSHLGRNSLSGIRGYKVFIGLSMILADCLFVFLSIMVRTTCAMAKQHRHPVFFALALALSVFREVANRNQWRIRHYIPSTIGMAVAFFMPPRMAIGMCIGSLAVYLWEKMNASRSRMLSPALASGLICGDGLGSLLLSMLTLVDATAPICIKFLSRGDNVRLDTFLAKLPMT